MNVFLIGYRGSGKTTAAQALAKLVGWPWLDADAVLEHRAGRTIRQIFAAGGEPAFRDLESAVVADLAGLDQHVVALGGGAVMREQNRQSLAGRGPVVWLRAAPELLHQRISADATTSERRPNLTGQGGLDEIRELLALREPVYQACANLVIDTGQLSPAQIALHIAASLSLKASP